MSERPARLTPGPLTRATAAELDRAAAANARHGRITATPPVQLHDSASGILLTADVDAQVLVGGRRAVRETVRRVQRPVPNHQFVESRYVRYGISRAFVPRPEPWPVRLFHSERTGSFAAAWHREIGGATTIPAGTSRTLPVGRYGNRAGNLGALLNNATISDFLPASAVAGTLAAPLGGDESDILLAVDDYVGYPGEEFLAVIEGEVLRVYAGFGSPSWTVERGYGADDLTPANVPTPHVAGVPILWYGEYHDYVEFNRTNAGEYLVTLYCQIASGLYDPENPDENYLAIEIVFKVWGPEYIVRVNLYYDAQSIGFGWTVREFAAGDTLSFQLTNYYTGNTIDTSSSANLTDMGLLPLG